MIYNYVTLKLFEIVGDDGYGKVGSTVAASSEEQARKDLPYFFNVKDITHKTAIKIGKDDVKLLAKELGLL